MSSTSILSKILSFQIMGKPDETEPKTEAEATNGYTGPTSK